jgi:hypothetical protein
MLAKSEMKVQFLTKLSKCFFNEVNLQKNYEIEKQRRQKM